MKLTLTAVLAALILTTLSERAHAVPIAATVTLQQPTPTIIGYQRVTTGKHWTWGGRTRKWVTVPIYATSAPIPEPSTYAMLLAGMGLVAWRVQRKMK
jgi:hypothetical protein